MTWVTTGSIYIPFHIFIPIPLYINYRASRINHDLLSIHTSTYLFFAIP